MIIVCPLCKRGKEIPLDPQTSRPIKGIKCDYCTTQIT